MKKTFQFGLTLIMLIILGNTAISQVQPGDPQYQTMKEQGQIPQPAQVTPVEPVTPILQYNPPAGSPAGLLVPLDGTFTLAMGPNDDGSTGLITLPWAFCFYGANQTGFYINNNGNVTFGGSTGSFSSTGFPVAGYPMLAPFWADVDTRPNLGAVYYKMTTNPNRVVVIWDNVGYYSTQGDKRNTFELIFTDGNDPILPTGDNVGFSFGDMQWTTGGASGGSGGFGGVAATVGVNKGDGTIYAQVGRFDHAGNDFDGAGGANDGISYLDNAIYHFDACAAVIIIPPNIPTMTEWGLIILGLALLGFGTFYIMKMRG